MTSLPQYACEKGAYFISDDLNPPLYELYEDAYIKYETTMMGGDTIPVVVLSLRAVHDKGPMGIHHGSIEEHRNPDTLVYLCDSSIERPSIFMEEGMRLVNVTSSREVITTGRIRPIGNNDSANAYMNEATFQAIPVYKNSSLDENQEDYADETDRKYYIISNDWVQVAR